MARRRSMKRPSAGDTGEPVGVLAKRPSKAKRDRRWEREQREKVGFAGYRGIPQELNSELNKVARELGVRVGDVARAFLEHGLAAYRSGDLLLKPQPRPDKLTLFPTE